MADQTAFAARVDELCARLGGPAELARKSGLSRRVIDKYRSGTSDPSRERLVAMAAAGGVSVEWLATGHAPGETPAAPSDQLFDEPLMRRMIEGVEKVVAERGGALSPVDKADLILDAYRLYRERVAAGAAPDPAEVVHLFRRAG